MVSLSLHLQYQQGSLVNLLLKEFYNFLGRYMYLAVKYELVMVNSLNGLTGFALFLVTLFVK